MPYVLSVIIIIKRERERGREQEKRIFCLFSFIPIKQLVGFRHKFFFLLMGVGRVVSWGKSKQLSKAVAILIDLVSCIVFALLFLNTSYSSVPFNM